MEESLRSVDKRNKFSLSCNHSDWFEVEVEQRIDEYARFDLRGEVSLKLERWSIDRSDNRWNSDGSEQWFDRKNIHSALHRNSGDRNKRSAADDDLPRLNLSDRKQMANNIDLDPFQRDTEQHFDNLPQFSEWKCPTLSECPILVLSVALDKMEWESAWLIKICLVFSFDKWYDP
jgi:hypothetical protein